MLRQFQFSVSVSVSVSFHFKNSTTYKNHSNKIQKYYKKKQVTNKLQEMTNYNKITQDIRNLYGEEFS